MDLGTGTGTSALFCALHGAEVTGVDVAQTAIEMAKRNALDLGLSIEFLIGDVLELSLDKKFALVIDSTLLHCLVGSDRRRFFEVARSHLSADGLLTINDMIASGDMSSRFPAEFFIFESDVLWSLGINEVSTRRMICGKSYFPYRTLLSLEAQRAEFSAHQFRSICEELVQSGEQDTDLTALLRPS